MKNVAKLALFLSVSFILILICGVFLSLLEDWTNSALVFPPNSDAFGVFTGKLTNYLSSSLPAAFYLSILLGLNYAARRRIFYPAAFAVILVFGVALGFGGFFGLENLNRIGFSVEIKKPDMTPAKPGFILNTGGASQMVFLGDPYKSGSARAVLSFNKSLSFQDDNTPLAGVRLPFAIENRGFLNSISRDLKNSTRVFSGRFQNGLISYCIYTGTLAAFLISLSCLVNISFWPLANLFFGILAFRGVLALESFLGQESIHAILVSFAGKIVGEPFINPVIFCIMTILILLYSGLIYLSRGRGNDG